MKSLTFSLLFIVLLFSYSVFAQTPEVIVTTGHNQLITILAISPDSKIIASCSADHIVKLWELNSGKELGTIFNKDTSANSEQRLNGFKFSSDSKFLLMADETGRITLWDIENEKAIRYFKGSVIIRDHNIDMMNDKIFYTDEFFQPHLFDMKTQTDSLLSQRRIKGGRINPANNNELVLFTLDSQILLLDLITLKEKWSFKSPMETLWHIEVSKNGKYLGIVLNTKELYLFDMKTGTELDHQDFGLGIHSIRFHPTTHELLCLCDRPVENQIIKRGLMLLKSGTCQVKETLPLITPSASIMDLDASGKYMVINSTGISQMSITFSIDIFEWEQSKLVKSLASRAKGIMQMVVANQSPYVVCYDSDAAMRIWNIEKMKLEKVEPYQHRIAGDATGKYLLTFGYTFPEYKMGFRIWDMDSLSIIHRLSINQSVISDLELLYPAKKLAISKFNGDIDFFDIQSSSLLKTLKTGKSNYLNFAWSPDNKYIAASELGTTGINIINTADGFIRSLDSAHIYVGASDLKFSPNSRYMLSGGLDGNVFLWQTETWKKRYELKGNIGPVWSLAFSYNNLMAASASHGSTVTKSDYAVNTWNVEDGKHLCKLLGHIKNVNCLGFYGKKNLLASGSNDGTMKIWNLDSCKEIASFIPINFDDYIIITPDFYYTGTKEALKGVGFKMNGKTLFPFEQFDLKLNRPDIIARRLGLTSTEMIKAYERAYQKRLGKMGFQQSMFNSDFHLPEAFIDNAAQIPFKSTQNSINLIISASDDRYLLDRVNIWVNDVPLLGIDGISVKKNAKNSIKLNQTIKLSNGSNKIQVSVLNEKGVESLKSTVFTTYNAEDQKSNLYIISIGVSKYADSTYNLTYAAKDAKDIIHTFSLKSELFNQIYPIELTDSNATRDNIMNTRAILDKTEVDDVVIFFLAGHGLFSSTYDYYFATHDINFGFPSESGITFEELEKLIDGIPARKKILFIDACHSGELDLEDSDPETTKSTNSNEIISEKTFTRGNLGNFKVNQSFELMKELFTDLRRGSGAVVISSAGGAEFAYESAKWKNGVFSFVLIDGLISKTADLNKDGIIFISELREYVTNRVQKLTKGKQKPTSRRDNLETDYIIWK